MAIYTHMHTHTHIHIYIYIYIYIHTHTYMIGLPGGSDGKESACNAGDLGLMLGSGRSSL